MVSINKILTANEFEFSMRIFILFKQKLFIYLYIIYLLLEIIYIYIVNKI